MCMYKLATSMCYRSPSVLDLQEICVCYSHSYRGLVCFLRLQQFMLLALEVPGVIYSELSKMVSVKQMHRCPHKYVPCTFLLHSSAAETEDYRRLWVEKQLWRKQDFYLLFSQVEWVCRCHSLLTLILEYLSFLTIHITMLFDQEHFNIPVFLRNELCRQFAIKRRLCSKPGTSAGNYAVSRVKCAVVQTAFCPGKHLQFATRGSQSVKPRLSVVLGSIFHQSQKTLQRKCRHCKEV